MLWQNASAATVATATPSSSRAQSSRSNCRTVVAPARRRQKAAKSCSPSSAVAAAFIRSTLRRRGYHSVSPRRSGSAVAGSSLTR